MLTAAAFASGDFTLDDQFERPHRRADVFKDGLVVIIAGAQRKTPDAMESWERALRPRVPEGTIAVGVFTNTGERLGIVTGEQTPARISDVLKLLGC